MTLAIVRHLGSFGMSCQSRNHVLAKEFASSQWRIFIAPSFQFF